MPDVYAAPVPTASGSEYLIEGWLVDEQFNYLFELDLAKVYEHSSLGQKTNGNQTYNAVSFAQGPLGSGIGTLVSHDLTTGRLYVGSTG